jgi:hypothetical protein
VDTAKKHLRFGGSSAERWLNCTGFVQLAETVPPQAENEYMAEGTRAHALLELAMREGRRIVFDFEDEKLNPNDPAFTADDVEAVQVAVDYCFDLLDKTPNSELYVERFVTADVAGEPVGGTADVMIYDPNLQALHVIDYKHGRGKYVGAEDNKQMKLYAMCALFSFTDHPVKVIYTTIIQPRCATGDPVRTAVYGVADLISYSDEVDAAVIEATGPNPKCPCAHICPALRDAATEVVTLPDEAAFRAPVGDEIKLILPPPAQCRDPGVLATTLRSVVVLKAWLDAIEDTAHNMALAGIEIPGFKLVAKRATRKWEDPAKAEAWFAGFAHVKQDDYAPRKLLSVAQAEKLLKPIDKEAVTQMAAFVEKKSSGYNLVPLEAKGDAVNPLLLAEGDFTKAVTVD